MLSFFLYQIKLLLHISCCYKFIFACQLKLPFSLFWNKYVIIAFTNWTSFMLIILLRSAGRYELIACISQIQFWTSISDVFPVLLKYSSYSSYASFSMTVSINSKCSVLKLALFFLVSEIRFVHVYEAPLIRHLWNM